MCAGFVSIAFAPSPKLQLEFPACIEVLVTLTNNGGQTANESLIENFAIGLYTLILFTFIKVSAQPIASTTFNSIV